MALLGPPWLGGQVKGARSPPAVWGKGRRETLLVLSSWQALCWGRRQEAPTGTAQGAPPPALRMLELQELHPEPKSTCHPPSPGPCPTSSAKAAGGGGPAVSSWLQGGHLPRCPLPRPPQCAGKRRARQMAWLRMRRRCRELGQRSQASQNPPRKSLAPNGPPATRCFFLLLVLRLRSSGFSPHRPPSAPGTAPSAPQPPDRVRSPDFVPAGFHGTCPARPCRTPPDGFRALPDLQRSPGDVDGPGFEVGEAAMAAGRGRCAFKVPPPRGRETACASPIPPGSARDEKHNA
uniref:basic salivary proline-rich protein 4-like n=1 Tax=Myodes glareolus TaxID=447135 RepID=UPI00202198C3|nr:basic salivary proline-rich protein 4-like [Myodes glareolus]